jgi:RNA polymerase sigma factor (TIGR02999 family)
MTDVTDILGQIEDGDPSAAEKLLPLVYEQLRRLAAARMADERSDHTLQATALVHEAYLRLVDTEEAQKWNSRGHFFGAAAEAMRRILVEAARKNDCLRHGGGRTQVLLNESLLPSSQPCEDILAVDEALNRLSETDEIAARFVELRFFAGMTVEEAAELLGISVRSAYYTWDYARSWLKTELKTED